MKNYRYDEFLDELQPALINKEPITVPANSPYYVPLREIPQKTNPSTVIVRAAGTGTTLTPDQDCSILSSATGANYDDIDDTGGKQLRVGKGNFPSSYTYRAFMRFNLSGTPTNPASVKLRLRFFHVGWVGSSSFGVFRVTSTWSETGPTWASQPTIDAIPQAQLFVPGGSYLGEAWVEADITNLYNAWKSGNNYGLTLRADESIDISMKPFTSRHHATEAWRPQLVITPAGQQLTELTNPRGEPGPGQFAISYQTGRMRFPSASAGASLEVDYRGLGSPVDVEDVMRQTQPASSGAPGRPGQMAWDATYLYIYTGSAWRRIAHSSF